MQHYLGTEMLRGLTPEQRDFLVRTSVLDEVSVPHARALGLENAQRILSELRSRHIPAGLSADGSSLRVHGLFRAYLQDLLRAEHVDGGLSLHRAYAEVLIRERRFEDAVNELLALGDVESAAPAIDAALPGIVCRLDFEVAERWLDVLKQNGFAMHPPHVLAQLMITVGREQYWRVVEMADAMTEPELAATVRSSPTAAGIVAWCYWHLGRIEDARKVFPPGGDSRESAIIEVMFGLSDESGRCVLPPVDSFTPGSLDAVVPRLAYYCGRLRLLEKAAHSSPWAATVGAAWYVGALRALGRSEDALGLYEGISREGTSAWLHAIAYPELLHDLGRREEAWAALSRGRGLIQPDGSLVHRVLSLLLEAKLHLRFDRDAPRAREALHAVTAAGPVSRYGFLREEWLTLMGQADLLEGRLDEAAEHLSAAVGMMRGSGCHLHLPVALVFLAEALWRRGEEDASDEAAASALAAAREQGSNMLLLQALADAPEVLVRGMDSEEDRSGSWHTLARSVRAGDSPVYPARLPVVRLHDLGALQLAVDGRPVRLRIRKSLELLAFLLGRPGLAAPRELILNALFDGRDDASSRSYLRQAVHRLREVFPPDVGPTTQDGMVRLRPMDAFDSDYARLSRLLRESHTQQDEKRLRLLTKAVRVAESGRYAEDVSARWVEDRRAAIDDLANDARQDAAALAYRFGGIQQARDLVTRLLEADPYREQAWQLAMRLTAGAGDSDGLLATYLRCRRTFEDMQIPMSAETVRLFESLHQG